MKVANLDLQYQKFPEISREEVKKFLQWIQAQPHLGNITEEEALHFFNACSYSMEVSKQVLDTNLTFRTHVKEFFGIPNAESPEMRRTMKVV